ncbi:hypothetical protein PACILC2_28540 [Paenibacillus cisolokensis]|uniref:Uncharacterized protein n=1 Tax=Paenibacillus cisolokensis TaxID=1658519 RepID=A0ABQ4N7Z4_9BACL|nr:hypothetical protein PACILC2_28540 [Paenibacillus cisolokensis]
MREHMGDDQFVLNERIAFKQEGVARVGIDDELINFAQAEIVLHFHFMERLAEAPVAEARRMP